MTKQHKRVMRLKWASLALTIAIALACLPWCGGYYGRSFVFATGRAQFLVQLKHTDYPKNPVIIETYGWWSTPQRWSDLLVTNIAHRNLFTRHVAHLSIWDDHDYFDLTVVLWAPLLLMTTATVLLWRWERRIRLRGHCKSCGYNLTGNISGVCPECGTGT